jgi:hypothetical protein
MMTFSTLSKSDCDVEGCDGFGFPECGECLPAIGHSEADKLTNRLNQMTNQPIALDK